MPLITCGVEFEFQSAGIKSDELPNVELKPTHGYLFIRSNRKTACWEKNQWLFDITPDRLGPNNTWGLEIVTSRQSVVSMGKNPLIDKERNVNVFSPINSFISYMKKQTLINNYYTKQFIEPETYINYEGTETTKDKAELILTRFPNDQTNKSTTISILIPNLPTLNVMPQITYGFSDRQLIVPFITSYAPSLQVGDTHRLGNFFKLFNPNEYENIYKKNLNKYLSLFSDQAKDYWELIIENKLLKNDMTQGWYAVEFLRMYLLCGTTSVNVPKLRINNVGPKGYVPYMLRTPFNNHNVGYVSLFSGGTISKDAFTSTDIRKKISSYIEGSIKSKTFYPYRPDGYGCPLGLKKAEVLNAAYTSLVNLNNIMWSIFAPMNSGYAKDERIIVQPEQYNVSITNLPNDMTKQWAKGALTTVEITKTIENAKNLTHIQKQIYNLCVTESYKLSNELLIECQKALTQSLPIGADCLPHQARSSLGPIPFVQAGYPMGNLTNEPLQPCIIENREIRDVLMTCFAKTVSRKEEGSREFVYNDNFINAMIKIIEHAREGFKKIPIEGGP